MKPTPNLRLWCVFFLLHCLGMFAVAQAPGTKLWEFVAGGPIVSSPAQGADGTIYFGSDDRKLYAVLPGGALKWTVTTGAEVRSSPAVGIDGTIYFGANDNKLYAVKPDGTVRWTFTTGNDVESTPAIGRDGTIYFGSRDGNFYALNPNGSQKWVFATGGFITSSAALAADGTIYFGGGDGNLYALNPNGTTKWAFSEGNGWLASPALGSNGTVYVGGLGRKLFAVNSSGVKLWDYLAGDGIWTAPAISPDGTIYFTTTSTYLYALNPNGTRRWLLETDYSPHQSPAVDALGNIYFAAQGAFYAATNSGTNGALLWSFFGVGTPYSSTLLDGQGVLYLTTFATTGRLYALQAAAGLATTSWPMHHRDTRRTGTMPIGSPPTVALVQPHDGDFLNGSSPLPLLASANDPDGAILKVEFYSNGDKLGEVASAPYSMLWSNVASGRYTITAVAVDNQTNATVSSAATVTVFRPGSTFPLLSTNSVWKYLDDGSNQGTAWTGTNFNDSSWRTGLAELGYGDGDEATVIRSDRADTTRIITSYFRRSFEVPDLSFVTNFAVRLRRDDGGVVYVNGVEVFRSNMPGGPVNYLTTASSTASDDGTNFFSAAINPGVFRSGTNVVAVEIHQFNTSSTDVSFELELLANTPLGGFPPVVRIASPSSGAVLAVGSLVPVSTQTSDGDGTVVRVEYFLGSASVGLSSVAPFGLTLSNVPPGHYTLTARATDNINFTSISAPVDLTVEANQPPSFAPGPDQTVLEDSGAQAVVGWASALSAGAVGEAGQTLTFVLTNDRPALFSVPPAINPSGTLTFTPIPNAFGTSVVTVVLRDDGGTAGGGNNTSAPQTFQIRVLSENDPPLAQAGEDQRLECNGVLTLVMLDASASTDPDGDSLSFAWREGDTLLATSAQPVIGLGTGIHIITLEVTDPAGSSSQDTLVVTIEDTTPPQWGLVLDRTVECDHVSAPANLSATDNCDPNPTITFSEVRSDGPCPQSYILTRRWTARDASGNSATNTQVITVEDIKPPILSGQGLNQTIHCPAPLVFTAPTAVDNCDPIPTITFTDFSTPGTGATLYTITRTWVAFDSCSNISASVSQAITVQDVTPPEITCPTNRVVEFTSRAGAVVEFAVAAAEGCASSVMTNCVPPSGSTFPIGTNTVHCTATDNATNAASCSFTVTVLGARGVVENILAELTSLRAAEPARLQGRRLDRAIGHLTNSLSAGLWRDQLPLPDESGKKVFGEHKRSYLYLHEWRKRQNDPAAEARVQGLIDRLVRTDRLVAVIAIEEATDAGAAPGRIAAARNDLLKGEREISQQHYHRGLERFRLAWLRVTRNSRSEYP